MTRKKVCQPEAPERERRLLVLGALLGHQRDQLAGDEREGDEDRGQHDAGHGEDDLEVVRTEPGSEPALRPEQQHVDQARDHRADRERQVDQGDQQALALELELGDRPGGAQAEDQVGGHRDRRHQQRQPDRRQRVGLDQRREIGAHALPQRLGKHREQRQEQKEEQEQQNEARDRPAWSRMLSVVGRRVGKASVVAMTSSYPAIRRRDQDWSRLITRSIANAATSMMQPIAVAPA